MVHDGFFFYVTLTYYGIIPNFAISSAIFHFRTQILWGFGRLKFTLMASTAPAPDPQAAGAKDAHQAFRVKRLMVGFCWFKTLEVLSLFMQQNLCVKSQEVWRTNIFFRGLRWKPACKLIETDSPDFQGQAEAEICCLLFTSLASLQLFVNLLHAKMRIYNSGLVHYYICLFFSLQLQTMCPKHPCAISGVQTIFSECFLWDLNPSTAGLPWAASATRFATATAADGQHRGAGMELFGWGWQRKRWQRLNKRPWW